MMSKLNFLLLTASMLLSGAFAQMDYDFCNVSAIVPAPNPNNVKMPIYNISMQYEMSYETNTDTSGGTKEMYEYYDGIGNIGIAKGDDGGIPTTSWAYFGDNELLTVSGMVCLVQQLNVSYDETPFFPIDTEPGKQHIVSALTLFVSNTPLLKYVYIGESVVRGIVVNQWQTCFDSEKTKTTQRITLSFSYPAKWSSALQPLESVPVEMKSEGKHRTESGTPSFTNTITTITKFKPMLTINQEDYITPSGVYCEGRNPLQKFPEIEDKFIYTLQIVEPSPGSNNKNGRITNKRKEFDFTKKLTSTDYIEDSSRFTRVRDFNTGLAYTREHGPDTCTISKISKDDKDFDEDGTFDGQYIKMRTASSLFGKDITNYQWTGQRRIKDINTDVWIAKVNDADGKGHMATYEWYFMADNWFVQEETGVRSKELISIIVTTYFPKRNPDGTTVNVPYPIVYYINNLDHTINDRLDYDVSHCLSQINYDTFRLTFKGPQPDMMLKHKNEFKMAIVDMVLEVAEVSQIRISNVNLYYENDSTLAVMSLMEKPESYGPVPAINEISLEVAMGKLSHQLGQKLPVSFTVLGTVANVTYTYTADDTGFLVFENLPGGFNYNTVKVPGKHGYTPVAIAFVSIACVLFGMIASLILTVLHKRGTIKLPFVPRP